MSSPLEARSSTTASSMSLCVRRIPGSPASLEVRSILRRACYDCHSNETVWPWYGTIAPMSWLIARDVRDGRNELNFSTWNRYTAEQQRTKLHECWEEVAEGSMPLAIYLPLHPDARLSESDREALRAWTQAP